MNAEQAPKQQFAGADLTVTQGRPLTRETDERTNSLGPAGVMAMACRQRRPDATREAPRRGRSGDQLEAREGQAGRSGVAERFVVPLKPGNSGGGKGPQFRTDAIRGDGPGRLGNL